MLAQTRKKPIGQERRRAISPAIAIVVLLAVAVVVTLSLSTFGQSVFGVYSQTPPIKIAHLALSHDAGVVRMTFQNTGPTPDTILSVSLPIGETTLTATGSDLSPNPAIMLPNSMTDLTATFHGAMPNVGDVVTMTALTSRGVTHTFTTIVEGAVPAGSNSSPAPSGGLVTWPPGFSPPSEIGGGSSGSGGGDSVKFLMQATPLHSESRPVISPNSTAAANLAHNNIPNPNYNGNDSLTFKTFDGHVDDNSNTTKASTVVNGLPDVGHAIPSTALLWPPNHEMVSIMILNVTSPHGEPVKITITGIWQDEPTTGAVGSGEEKLSDGSGIGTSIAQVRSERDGTGDGRVYHIYFTADDGHGGITQGQVLVSVPHDQSGKPALDEGSLYDSTKKSS